jgi:hypothetical protein
VQRFVELQHCYQSALSTLIEELAHTLTVRLARSRSDTDEESLQKLRVVYKQMLQAMQVLEEGRRAKAGQLLYFDLAQLEHQLKVWLQERIDRHVTVAEGQSTPLAGESSQRTLTSASTSTSTSTSPSTLASTIATGEPSSCHQKNLDEVRTPSRKSRPTHAPRTPGTPRTPGNAHAGGSSSASLRTPNRSLPISTQRLALLSPLSPLRMRTQPCFTPHLQRKRRLSGALPSRRILDIPPPIQPLPPHDSA